MRISLKALNRRVKDFGFEVELTDAGVYQIKSFTEYGTIFDGSYAEVLAWLGGWEFRQQALKVAA